jgi:drug/metabolite transporter (DMT)-like permease
VALLAVYIIWGSTYLAIRFAVAGLPPLLMSGVRFLLAGAGLFIVLRLRGAAAPTMAQWRGAGALGIFLLVGGNGAVAVAELRVSSSLTAMMIATTPLWAALFAGVWGHWPTGKEWIGLTVGFAGVILLNVGGGLRASPFSAGLLLLAAASWAFGTIVSRRLALPRGLMASAAEMIVGGGLLILAGIVRGEHIPTILPLPSLLAMGYLIVVGSLVAYSAYNYLLVHARPTLATSYAYVNPLVAVLLGVGLAGEKISPSGIFALAIILAGVVIVVLARERTPGV